MPLLTKMLPLRETVEDLQATSLHSQHQDSVRDEKDKDSGYEDFEEYDDECLSSDMEGSVIHRGRPKKVVRAPAIPARNEKRASKILESVMIELKTLDGAETKDADSRSMVQESDPHESYLSSEEDASLSDDYEDSLNEFEGTSSSDATSETRESFSRSSRRESQEDTARVVSFICVGKPQIVDIFIPSNHTSPVEGLPKRHSMNMDALTALTQAHSLAKSARRPMPLKLYPSSVHRMSISSMTSSHTSNSSTYAAPTTASTTNLTSLPPRKSSRLALNINSLVTSTRNTLTSSFSAPATIPSNSFLSVDPFAQDASRTDEPTTPKTPTSIAAAAWKRGISKTLSKARKPSMPKLSMAYGNSSVSNFSSTSYIASPEKSRAGRRISTSHSNYSSLNLERTIDEEKEGEREADVRSRSSSYSNSSSQPQTQQSSVPKENNIKRANTMSALTSPLFAPNRPQSQSQSQSQTQDKVRYEDIMKSAIRGPPPIPKDNPASNDRGRRSFSFGVGVNMGMGMGMGLGRRKSVKAK
ncbi:hypothetical protein EG329_004869 [Mollisiaceae sp. DMI_Dod_QoI]|nr:hypothetical protein EG329_004869 [Helotiales sp. DMI_Dod_QoI]